MKLWYHSTFESYFPSVPVPDSIETIEAWLDTQTSVNHIIREAYVDLTQLCMNQAFFKFRGQIYQQISGTSMGNPLSPFICDTYVRNFEEKISTDPNFPRFWRRYVDDIFAIVKKDMVNVTLDWLNGIDQNLKFTHEIEVEGRLQFLELMIYRSGNEIDFKIYRKPTSTDRYITIDSFHAPNHQHAAFNSMAFRLCNLPLNDANFNEELTYMKKLAQINGFSKDTLDTTIRKHQNKLKLRKWTTLAPLKDDSSTRNSFNYFPTLTNKMKNVLKKHNAKMVYSSKN